MHENLDNEKIKRLAQDFHERTKISFQIHHNPTISEVRIGEYVLYGSVPHTLKLLKGLNDIGEQFEENLMFKSK